MALPLKKKRPMPFGKKKKKKPPFMAEAEPPEDEMVEEEEEDPVGEGMEREAPQPKGKKDIFAKWAKGRPTDSMREGAKPPKQIEDKLIDKVAEMRPMDDDLDMDIGMGMEDDPELDMGFDPMLPEDPCWAGECDMAEVGPEEAQALVTYLEENEPEIHKAVVSLASTCCDGDAEGVDAGKEAIMEAEQYDPVYDEFDEGQRQKLGDSIVEYISAADYPEMGSPEMVQAIAHAVVEARGGESLGEEMEDEELALEDDMDEMPDEEMA